jgi:hypothetical protein
MHTKEEVESFVQDWVGKKPRNIIPFNINDLIAKVPYNYIDRGKQSSSSVGVPSGFPNKSPEILYFGTLIFNADNFGAASNGVIDTLAVFYNQNKVCNAYTTSYVNQRPGDSLKFEDIFFDSLELYAANNNSSLMFFGWKVTM